VLGKSINNQQKHVLIYSKKEPAMKKTVFATLAVFALAFPHLLPAHTGDPCPHKDPNHPHCAGGSPGIERLAVFDAQNQKVGDVIAFERLGGLAQVSFSSGTYSFFLYVFPTRFAGTSPRIHFTGVNCQGTPILEVSGTSGSNAILSCR
jgi:hypothetical protein